MQDGLNENSWRVRYAKMHEVEVKDYKLVAIWILDIEMDEDTVRRVS